jgi:hypothetical protein
MGLRYMGRGSLSRAHQYGKDAAGDKEHDGRGEEEFEGVDRPPGTEDEWLPCVDAVHPEHEQGRRDRRPRKKFREGSSPVETARAREARQSNTTNSG